MKNYEIGDIFEYIDRHDINFRDVIAIRIIAKFKNKKKGKNIQYYRIEPLYGVWEESEDPNRWRWVNRRYQDGLTITCFKLGNLLRENKVRKLTPDKAALLLLKHQDFKDSYSEDLQFK